MQTFMTSATYANTASTLDRLRLNKQALEGWQIMMTNLKLDPQGNHREPRGWYNHPAVKMWRGYEVALSEYVVAMCDEWRSRGYNTTIADKALATIEKAISLGLVSGEYVAPHWQGDSDYLDSITSSHRVALLNKNYEWYSQFGWAEDTGERPETYDYVWAV